MESCERMSTEQDASQRAGGAGSRHAEVVEDGPGGVAFELLQVGGKGATRSLAIMAKPHCSGSKSRSGVYNAGLEFGWYRGRSSFRPNRDEGFFCALYALYGFV